MNQNIWLAVGLASVEAQLVHLKDAPGSHKLEELDDAVDANNIEKLPDIVKEVEELEATAALMDESSKHIQNNHAILPAPNDFPGLPEKCETHHEIPRTYSAAAAIP